MMTFKEAKKVIREALSKAPMERLVRTLDDARDGNVPFWDCESCLAGHLKGYDVGDLERDPEFKKLSDAYNSFAYSNKLWIKNVGEEDLLRYRTLIPIIKSEIRSRVRKGELGIVETKIEKEVYHEVL